VIPCAASPARGRADRRRVVGRRRLTWADAACVVEVRPSGEFSLDRAKARLKAIPLPPTLRHAGDGDRELYLRTLASLENVESVGPGPGRGPAHRLSLTSTGIGARVQRRGQVRCAGALLAALKGGRAGVALDPEAERDAVTVRVFYSERTVHLNSNAFRSGVRGRAATSVLGPTGELASARLWGGGPAQVAASLPAGRPRERDQRAQQGGALRLWSVTRRPRTQG